MFSSFVNLTFLYTSLENITRLCGRYVKCDSLEYENKRWNVVVWRIRMRCGSLDDKDEMWTSCGSLVNEDQWW